MADSGRNSSTQFTYIWRIENYRQPHFLKLQSPTFTVDSIEKTKWCLVLLVNQLYVLCYIKRQMDRSALKSMGLDFELAILTADGTPACEQSDVFFRINPHSKIIKLIENSVLCERSAEFLPNDTLTIRCRIRRRDAGIASDLCFACTQLRDVELSFIWAVENFKLLQPGHKINYSIQTEMYYGFTLNLVLYLEQDDVFHIEIHTLGERYCSIKYKISAMDTKGKIIQSVENGCRLHLNEQIMTFPLLIGKKELMALKDPYLLNDVLILRCELDFFGGTICSRIEYSLQSSYSDDARKKNSCIIEENSIPYATDCCVIRSLNTGDHAMSKNNCIMDENSIPCVNDRCLLMIPNADSHVITHENYIPYDADRYVRKSTNADNHAMSGNNKIADENSSPYAVDRCVIRSLNAGDHAMSENNCIMEDNSIPYAADHCLIRSPRAVDHAMAENNYSIDENFISCNDYCTFKKTLKFIREEMIFNDVILRTGRQSFPAHQNILSVRCPIFKTMFRCDMLDGDSSVIDLQNLGGNTLNHLLLYIYTDNLDNLRRKDVMDLLCIADEYGLTDLKKRCSSILKANPCKSNTSDVLFFPDVHQDGNLIHASKYFTSQHKRRNTKNIFQKCRKRISKGNN